MGGNQCGFLKLDSLCLHKQNQWCYWACAGLCEREQASRVCHLSEAGAKPVIHTRRITLYFCRFGRGWQAAWFCLESKARGVLFHQVNKSFEVVSGRLLKWAKTRPVWVAVGGLKIPVKWRLIQSLLYFSMALQLVLGFSNCSLIGPLLSEVSFGQNRVFLPSG